MTSSDKRVPQKSIVAPAMSSRSVSALNKQLIRCLSRRGRSRERVSHEDLFEEVVMLLEQGADPNYQRQGIVPMCEVCRLGRYDIVQMLLAYGGNGNICDGNQCSPLYLAASHGHVEIVKLLLEHGSDIDAKTRHGYFPLLSAVENNHMEVARFLIESGADVNISRPTFCIEMSLLTFVLFAKGDFIFAECLLQAGVKPHAFETPLDFILLGLGDECRNFVKRLIYAGFEFHSECWMDLTKNKLKANLADVSVSEHDMLKFLEKEKKDVPSLQRLCRTTLRTSLAQSCVRVHLKTKIEQLPLPTEVKKYLALEYLE